MTISSVFDAAGVRGFLHARCVGCDHGAGLRADEPVVLSSVVKVPLVLEFARQVAAGQLDPADRVRVRAADRLGGTGTAGCADDVEFSLRDAALFALSLSDNTAADLLFDRVGLANVRSLVRELGLANTRIYGSPRDILRAMIEDLGARDAAEFAERYAALTPAQVGTMRALDPRHATASTPRELTRLLQLVWRDEAGPAEACAQVRALMRQQINWYRLTAGFPPEVRVAGKTGTLPGMRAEIGVAEYPDGGRYAVAVFTRADTLEQRLPHVDRAIGEAALAAVTEITRHPCPARCVRGESSPAGPASRQPR
ncbi:serine hydrolase [Amycolatopsis anabasis]|uniref:serine hydrolase n=1 Tax=Amycolatopsis anabasis TaxID=1840409 RepID=UPI00131E55DE|nr:serine hydrolase [Amycolatopsis anabasis]